MLVVIVGLNEWTHHRRQVLDAEPAAALLARREQVERDARAFNLSGVTVMGADGQAFQIGREAGNAEC